LASYGCGVVADDLREIIIQARRAVNSVPWLSGHQCFANAHWRPACVDGYSALHRMDFGSWAASFIATGS